MIEIWKCKIKPIIPGNIFPSREDEIRDQFWAKWHNIGDIRFMQIYYFYNILPRDPLIISYHSPRIVSVAPGIQRYIGCALREEPVWLDAILYNRIGLIRYPELKIIEKIDTVKGKDPRQFAESHEKPNHTADEEKKWFVENTQNVSVEIISEFGQKLLVNPNGDWNIKAFIEDYNGIGNTLREVFKKIKQA